MWGLRGFEMNNNKYCLGQGRGMILEFVQLFHFVDLLFFFLHPLFLLLTYYFTVQLLTTIIVDVSAMLEQTCCTSA